MYSIGAENTGNRSSRLKAASTKAIIRIRDVLVQRKTSNLSNAEAAEQAQTMHSVNAVMRDNGDKVFRSSESAEKNGIVDAFQISRPMNKAD